MTDFFEGYNYENNYIINNLKKYYDVVIDKQNPDYVICSVFGNEYLKYPAIRIMYTGENFVPNFNYCDYGIGFEYMTFADRYVRFPNYPFYVGIYEAAMKKHIITDEEICNKNDFCNFIYSNGSRAIPERELFFDKLSSYKKVSSAGKFRNNIGESVKDKLSFQKKSKFTIAFENSNTPGYSTEKILYAFAAKTIPIYYGDPLIAKQFNSDSFINCHDYRTFEDVIETVKQIDNNFDLYKKILQTPIFNKNTTCQEYTFEKVLLTFFDSIFSQEKDKAYRRTNYAYPLTWYRNTYYQLDRYNGLKNTLKKYLPKFICKKLDVD